MRSVRTLLEGVIDYAGLFPPAGLDMTAAVANYASYRSGETRWMLGRFVVPAARLDEFARAAAPCLPKEGAPWRLSALSGPDPERDLTRIAEFNRRHAGRAAIEAIEAKAASGAELATPAWPGRSPLEAYVELPAAEDPAEAVAAIARAGARPKLRTGGIAPEAFPPVDRVVGFIRACLAVGVAFKATAGLHHALTGSYPLTYEPNSPRAPMFGFLNLFLAAAMARQGRDDGEVREVLEETSPGAFSFTDERVGWRGRWVSEAELGRTRREVAIGFGSCSFVEPVDELRALGLL